MKKEREEVNGEFQGKYLGPLQIKSAYLAKEKTYLGNKKVVLILESDEEKELPLEVVKNVIADEKSDWTELREKWVIPVVEKLLIVLTESELGNNDLHYALDVKLGESIKMASDRAQMILFGKPKEDISLMDIEKVLRKNKQKNDTRN